MNRTEWVQRCAARLRALGLGDSLGENLIGPHAEHLADEQTELHGSSGLAWEAPEGAAEADMANYAEDEES